MLHTLDLSLCHSLTDVSALARCATLHTLTLTWCGNVREVSALAGCTALHTLDLSHCYGLMARAVWKLAG